MANLNFLKRSSSAGVGLFRCKSLACRRRSLLSGPKMSRFTNLVALACLVASSSAFTIARKGQLSMAMDRRSAIQKVPHDLRICARRAATKASSSAEMAQRGSCPKNLMFGVFRPSRVCPFPPLF
eukprot:scaffold48_cov311-Pinguiococcus_pyrenoidosus.AAC.312